MDPKKCDFQPKADRFALFALFSSFFRAFQGVRLPEG
jgi:hypothetical protein